MVILLPFVWLQNSAMFSCMCLVSGAGEKPSESINHICNIYRISAQCCHTVKYATNSQVVNNVACYINPV